MKLVFASKAKQSRKIATWHVNPQVSRFRVFYLSTFSIMNTAAIIFSIVILLILFRAFMLKARANRLDSPAFRALPKDAALAVLKDRLLNSPTEGNLQNLVTFAAELGQSIDANDYRPLLQEQIKLSDRPDALAEDNELFAKEAAFLDSITPPEIESAAIAKNEGKTEEYITLSLQAIERFYSDEKIESTLETLIPVYPKASEILEGYRKLKDARDKSLADEESLKKLREMRNAWEESLRF